MKNRLSKVTITTLKEHQTSWFSGHGLTPKGLRGGGPKFKSCVSGKNFIPRWKMPTQIVPPTYFFSIKKKNTTLKGNCYVNNTLRLKSITVNKHKLNNKHTHKKHKNLCDSANYLPPQRRWRNFTIKIGRYNSVQKHSKKSKSQLHHRNNKNRS